MARKADRTPLDGLMAAFQRTGAPAAFERIVAEMLTPAVAVAGRLLGGRRGAEDAVQEAFLRVVRNRRAYDGGRSFRTWFYAILRNVCRDMLRSRARRERLLREAALRAVETVDPPAPADSEALRLLEALPAGERHVLALRVVEGLAFREVAAALGISEEAAKKRAQRGLRRLRRRYESAARREGSLAAAAGA